jgi:hypothetical protein
MLLRTDDACGGLLRYWSESPRVEMEFLVLGGVRRGGSRNVRWFVTGEFSLTGSQRHEPELLDKQSNIRPRYRHPSESPHRRSNKNRGRKD